MRVLETRLRRMVPRSFPCRLIKMEPQLQKRPADIQQRKWRTSLHLINIRWESRCRSNEEWKLINWAGETGSLIIEDDYDSEYRYAQTPIPALQGLDSSQRTIYVGSFSKVIFPALSLGYVIVPLAMAEVFEGALSLSSRSASVVDQYILHDFISEGYFGRHLRRMRKTHWARRTIFVEEIAKRLPDILTVLGSQAGLHCTAMLNSSRIGASKKASKSDVVVAQKLEKAGVIARPLSNYYLPETPPSKRKSGLVFGFACAPPRQIVAAVKKIAETI